MVVLDSVTDVKDWMSDQTPLLHDHLKADQTPLLHDHLKADQTPLLHDHLKADQTPLLHDHLKAQQFKFQRNESGECVMFYKEWSTDPFWLPQSGLAFLPNGNTIPSKLPLMVTPYYDPDNLKLLENTLKRIRGYLNKSTLSASAWWTNWLKHAHQLSQKTKSQPIKGESV